MQTYGQATHLGYLQLTLEPKSSNIVGCEGRLLPVEASKVEPDPRIQAKLSRYRGLHLEIMAPIE